MNGLHADGSRATGFKSMVLAQYTGIALQKDDRAFEGSNLSSGITQTNGDGNNYHVDPNSVYRDDWRHYHICLLYTSPSPRDQRGSRMPSSA